MLADIKNKGFNPNVSNEEWIQNISDPIMMAAMLDIENQNLPPYIPMVYSQCHNKVVDPNNVRLTIAEVNLIARHNPEARHVNNFTYYHLPTTTMGYISLIIYYSHNLSLIIYYNHNLSIIILVGH